MSSSGSQTSRGIRRELGHPVIDADGHIQEYLPHLLPFLRETLGPTLFDRFLANRSPLGDIVGGEEDLERRRRSRVPQSAWWGTPSRNTRDLATASVPRLLYERLDEFGIDFSVLYPTKAFGMAGVGDEEMRLGLCRGFNEYAASVYAPYRGRLTVAGVIPMNTPQEAVDEIHHCRKLGLKVVGLPEGVVRAIEEPGVSSPWLLPGQAHWFDTFGLDSACDYDPVWRTLDELGLAATFHGGIGALMPFTYTSISSYVFNHVGFFAERMQKLCKSLFLGGVTARFPRLNIAFLECGVGWACTLLSDLVEHWEKRNLNALLENLDPARIDWEELELLVRTYGPELVHQASNEEIAASVREMPVPGIEPPDRDEFRALEVASEDKLVERFVPRLYFGCEADDRTVAFAFSPANVRGETLRPVFSSDIGHWDVVDMAQVLADAHGLVREGLLDDEQFAQFVFENPVRLFAGRDPAFFEGTVVADQAKALTMERGEDHVR